MSDQAQYARYRDDAKTVAAIGACVETQVDRITVRLPKGLAEAAIAAWDRDEADEPGEESHEQHAAREHAAELALIGLTISERGRWEGEEVAVDVDVASVGMAIRAHEQQPTPPPGELAG
ncbi:hypothetical protein ACQEU8_01750 [Streptomyces sp. CA-250714]|uniref:hypothetical protein n=1 Tax=Streptomyces sp. CA-250714 TaxID=3240060 RepID=UPI003D8C9CA4